MAEASHPQVATLLRTSEARRSRAGGFWVGFVTAVLIYLTVKLLMWNWEGQGYIVAPFWGVLGGLVNRSRVRWTLWLVAVGLAVLVLVAAYSDVFVAPGNALVRRDPLGKADAVVVLSGGVTYDGKLDGMSLQRTLDAMGLVRAGWAPVLIRTCTMEGTPPPDEDVRYFADLYGGVAVEVVGPIGNTQAEATKTAELAAERGWSSIILVTSPIHSVRAAATFEKLGLRVISAPCWERDYSLRRPRHPCDRLDLFRRYVYEVIGWQIYRMRGWV